MFVIPEMARLEAGTVDPRTPCLASLGCLVKFQANEKRDPVSNKKQQMPEKYHPRLFSDVYMSTHM